MDDYTEEYLRSVIESGNDPKSLLPIGIYIYRKLLFRFTYYPNKGIKFFGLGIEEVSGWIPMDEIKNHEYIEILNGFVGVDSWVIMDRDDINPYPVDFLLDSCDLFRTESVKKNRIIMACFIPYDKDPSVLSYQRKIYARTELDRIARSWEKIRRSQ